MVTYSLKEVSALPEVMEDLLECGNDYPLIDRIIEDISNKGMDYDIDSIVKYQIVKYLCNCNHCTLLKDYEDMGIDSILYEDPITDMPLYLNCSDTEVLKKVAATWRLKIGR